MIGLANSAAVNLPALFGGSALTAEPTVESMGTPFLDLLWMFDTQTIEIPAAPTESPEPAASLESAPPKVIAEALIRSMFAAIGRPTPQQAPRPSTEDVPAIGAEADAASVVSTCVSEPTVEPGSVLDREEDWDLPFDWIAPEEMADPESFDIVETATVTPLQAPLVAEPANDKMAMPPASSEMGQRTADEPLPVSRRQVKSEFDIRGPVVSLQKRSSEEPLAFALKLRVDAEAELSSEPVVRQAATELASKPAIAEEVPQESLLPRVLAAPAPERNTERAVTVAPIATQGFSDDARPAAGKDGSEPDTQQFGQKGEAKDPSPRVSAHKSTAIPATSAAAQISVAATLPMHAPVEGHSIGERQAEPALLSPAARTQQVSETEVLSKSETRSASAREIAVRISSPTALPVDLQVRSRGGEVHVAVHTADVGLNASLRQDLGSLVKRLEQSGFRAETVVARDSARSPVESVSSFDISHTLRMTGEVTSQSADSQSDSPRDGGWSSGSQNPESGARQQRRHQSPHQNGQQKWTEAMEDQD